MSHLNHRLQFRTLRHANLQRLPHFKNAKGDIIHQPDGSDWLLSQWCNAASGELGEAANLIKKYERGDMDKDILRGLLSDELADVLTYVDLLAYRAGIELDTALLSKWNEVSRRVGSPVRIAHDDWHYKPVDDDGEAKVDDDTTTPPLPRPPAPPRPTTSTDACTTCGHILAMHSQGNACMIGACQCEGYTVRRETTTVATDTVEQRVTELERLMPAHLSLRELLNEAVRDRFNDIESRLATLEDATATNGVHVERL